MRFSWIARLPGNLFGISFGLFGLSGAWRRASKFGWPLAEAIEELLFFIAFAVWAILLAFYLLKIVLHTRSVVREFLHPVQGPLLVLMPLSAFLIFVLRAPDGWWAMLALVAAMLVQGVIALRVMLMLATSRIASDMVTPALYLPIVGGGFISGMAMTALHHRSLGTLLFGMGLMGWVMLEGRVLHRLFAGPLPQPWRPTIAIEASPPTVVVVAASIIWPEVPAEILNAGLGICIVSGVTIAARCPWWSREAFSAGFWSFSFPLAAFASGMIEAARRGGWSTIPAALSLLFASAVIAYLLARTLHLLLTNRLLPQSPLTETSADAN